MTTDISTLDPAALERIRWRCRRGLLELDIVFERFIPQYINLNSQQQLEFDKLLDLPDTELWNKISGKVQGADTAQRTLLAIINSA